jgi:2-haloacid dehalogenase
MSSSKEIVIAFDAYGTLLSTEAIADQLSAHFGTEKAKSIAAKWRLYQLEYTWRLNSMRNGSIPNSYRHTRY